MGKQIDRTSWKERIEAGFGASDAGAIMGVSSYKTPIQLVQLYKGEKEPDDLSENESILWGNLAEEMIIRKLTEIDELVIDTPQETFYHKELPYLYCHVDGISYQANSEIPIEIKNSREFMKDAFGEEDSHIVYKPHYWQCQQICAILEAQAVYLYVLFGGNSLKRYIIERDEADIAELLTRAKFLWEGCIHGDNMPEPMDYIDSGRLFASKDNDIKANTHAEMLHVDAVDLTKKMKETKALLDNAKKDLRMFIGNNNHLVDDDGKTLAKITKNNQMRLG